MDHPEPNQVVVLKLDGGLVVLLVGLGSGEEDSRSAVKAMTAVFPNSVPLSKSSPASVERVLFDAGF